MSNYFDNQPKWSWQVSDNKVLVTTDHGNHTHTMEVTNVPIGEMVEHTGQVMGDAHRSVPHDFKTGTEQTENVENSVSVDNAVENNVVDNPVQSSAPEESSAPEPVDNEAIDGGEDCEDGLDL